MNHRNWSFGILVLTLGTLAPIPLTAAAAPATEGSALSSGYTDLVTLFHEFRRFHQPPITEGVPDFSAATMKAIYDQLGEYQSRLVAIDPSGWPVSEQVDYHLVRAEMNGMEFQHRVLSPWSLDPGFYNDVLRWDRRPEALPLTASQAATLQEQLVAVPGLLEQARVNLSDFNTIAADLGALAMLSLADTHEGYERLRAGLAEHHPDLVDDAKRALAAIDAYSGWIEDNKHRMTARAGVGKKNYSWLMKNVYLFPYTWDEIRLIVELEDNRVRTFQRLEANRNRDVPPIQPVQSQAEYKASVADAIEHLMDFLVEEEIFTVDDYLTPDEYFGSWHGFGNPWPERHDYFFNFSHREPVMEETHEMVGHHFDGLRSQSDNREIRGGRRPYKIGTARGEGFAFAIEELLMYAGYLEGRNPHGREIAYEQSAFRTVRALSDIYMHSGDWSYEDAYRFCVENAPHGELLDGSHHLWYELDTTLRGVGHHMLMVVGKVQFIKLFRDRANQLGDEFVLRDFVDDVLDTGSIPWSLIRWEMTGYTDEMERLMPGESSEYDFDGDLHSRFYDHPAWASREAEIVQTDGRASLTATGTHISEAWKTWHEPLPHDRDWSIAVDVTVPRAWDSVATPEAQVGAGPWLGRLDPEGKGHRVYEVNLATIANQFRFVQGQLIENRLGEDPIAVGHIMVPDETMRLEISYRAEPPTISLTANGTYVDSRSLDSSGLDNWEMTGDDVFYVGIMGFAENSDLTQHPVTLDNFEVTVDR